MSVVLKKTSKNRTGFTSSTRLITKSFDLGDPALMKSFSQLYHCIKQMVQALVQLL